MMGLQGQRPTTTDGKTLDPPRGHGLPVMSIGFLVDSDQPMAWRGPMVTQALAQMLADTRWGELDYLVVDMPPGTGDIQLTLTQRVPVSGAVIVTTPQEIALLDARKGLQMFRKVGVPVLGIVENMGLHRCPACGHESHIFDAGGGSALAGRYETTLLGELPLDGAIREQADSGRPTVVADPESANAAAFHAIARRAAGALAASAIRGTVKMPDHPHRGRVMTIKSDRWIRRMATQGMIEPFEAGQVRDVAGQKIVSYGTSSYGYDVRCAPEFKIFTNINSTIIDPKHFDPKNFVDFEGEVCIIPPNSFALARTVEYFRIPRNVMVICLGKSTYARCGIIVNVTPLEPEWEGHVTLEFSNTTPLAGPHLRERGRGAVPVLRVGRGLRDLVQGPRRQVPGPEGRDAAEDLRGDAQPPPGSCRM